MTKVFDVSESIAAVMLILFVLICSGGSPTEAQNGHLPDYEKDALRDIAKELGKKDWNFSQNPCDNNTNWLTPKRKDMPSYNNTVVCNCSFPNNQCHVIYILIDLSYNKFLESSAPSTCTRETLNLFRSFSGGNNLELGNCLKKFPCPNIMYSLHINCGGQGVKIGKNYYEADDDRGSSAKFVPQVAHWGTSSTGNFWDVNKTDNFIAQNVSILRKNISELYMTARRSPLSLTYFGRCLANGNYTVTLHFAEIIFRNNRSYQSLGRRMFDVYIQDERVLKDFDIEHEAPGIDNPFLQKFNTTVKNRTLEIRFHWAGKGTTAVPVRGNYGPLISAISMEANFKPRIDQTKKIVIVVGSVAVALVCLIFTGLCFLWWKGCLASNTSKGQGDSTPHF